MIGVFDSGSGGLTVVRAIRERLSSADVLYFGDIKNAPYGSKTPEELFKLTISAIDLLKKNGATSIVSACNSVSASLAISLFDALDLTPQSLIEMVGPTVSYFRGSPAKILLVATPATTQSGVYQSAFRMIGKDVTAVSIPDLASAIEFGAPAEKIEECISGALPKDPASFDAVILACTHYPLALSVFRRLIPPKVLLFDPALAVAERVEKRLWPREAGNGQMRFLISKDSPPFRTLVTRFFPDNANAIEVIE